MLLLRCTFGIPLVKSFSLVPPMTVEPPRMGTRQAKAFNVAATTMSSVSLIPKSNCESGQMTKNICERLESVEQTQPTAILEIPLEEYYGLDDPSPSN